jgi:8-oxo-dGTP pyrophosphatase MutT (NUDIX family)
VDKPITQKALVYCVDAGKLLVFRHVDRAWEEAGVQVPAGTIRTGEIPEHAAARELCEETGRDTFEIEGSLGTARFDMSPYRSEIQERHFFRARPTARLPERWFSHENHDGERAPIRFECFWIPLAHGHVLQAGQSAMLWKLAS